METLFRRDYSVNTNKFQSNLRGMETQQRDDLAYHIYHVSIESKRNGNLDATPDNLALAFGFQSNLRGMETLVADKQLSRRKKFQSNLRGMETYIQKKQRFNAMRGFNRI